MSEKSLYDPAAQPTSTTHKTEHAVVITKMLHELLIRELFPKFQSLLAEKEPVPQYAIKIGRHVMEHNPAFGVIFQRL
eukprot:CAMPEP_0184315204 /NCGR_PEP_ID=MMETSP1049-20130417/80711_1 /TAXON_ID=77928 /ORGANISM="Proteomonas sulcata, Strain CCMP704" /LENGTH=77 /DNA_ID=CAMNT_0026633539 /DNA_START=11 /DNA_END=240 /DNA_ORIENTATION=+